MGSNVPCGSSRGAVLEYISGIILEMARMAEGVGDDLMAEDLRAARRAYLARTPKHLESHQDVASPDPSCRRRPESV